MVESFKQWRAEVRHVTRIVAKLEALESELRRVNVEHVPTSMARTYLRNAIGTLTADVRDQAARIIREEAQ